MAEKKVNKKDGDVREDILEEISQYKFSGTGGKSVKRFVWEDPTKKTAAAVVKKPIETKAQQRPKEDKPAEPKPQPVVSVTKPLPTKSFKLWKWRKPSWKIWSPLALVLAIVIFGWFFYNARLYETAPGLAKALPWPAGYVNGQSIPLQEFLDDVGTLKGFYERAQESTGTNANLDLAQIEEAVIDRMVKDAILADFAERNSITISDTMISDEIAKIEQDFGSPEELSGFIKQNYDWNIEQFKDKVIRPYLLRQQVEIWFQQNESAQTAAIEQINSIYDELKTNAISFSDAAAKYSQDETNALYGGYLGVFAPGVMVPEFEAALVDLDVDELSAPVQTMFGWHLIKREPIPTGDEYQATDLAASHILIKVFDYDAWLNEETEKSSVWLFVNLRTESN